MIVYVCLCLHTSLWFVCAPNVTQMLRQKRETLGGNPSTNSKARLGLHPLKRANSALVLVGWEKEDGECHSVLVSGLKSAFNSLITLPQIHGSVAAVQFCFSTKADETAFKNGVPWYSLFALLCMCFSQPSTQAFCWREVLECFPERNQVLCAQSQASTKLCLFSGMCPRNELSIWVE